MDRVDFAFIGFGEAGMAFARWGTRVYDRKTDDPATRAAKREDYRAIGVLGCDSAAEAVGGAGAVLSLVTADQALAAARAAAPLLPAGALWLDMNSVAPETKREAARAVEATGGRYVDVAVMAPVHPRKLEVPLLLSGAHAEAGLEALQAIGFTDARIVAGPLGAAAAVKMIRSVLVKGVEALTAECVLAAEAAGVTGDVLASLDATPPRGSWSAQANYNLDRMMLHGERRAAEMEEALATLEGLGAAHAMTRGTIAWQRAIGALGLVPAPGLDAKIAAIRDGGGPHA
jgi:3-hydroxyisobutyrate dehydrogenase-like beta-hydroxyacid dehydrogenase